MGTPKVIALEGEFAMTEGHAQELKTQAIALQVGKRLRIFLSDNNAGIDDSLIGGVVSSKFTGYRLVDQWTSYGWNVLRRCRTVTTTTRSWRALKTMEDWDPTDRRPMIVIGTTTKGYWPGAVNGKIPGAGDQVVGYPSHPYAMKMNSEYFVALARTFEERYGVEFQGIRQGPVTDPRERLIQFKTNIDVVMSVLDAMASATGWPIVWSRSATRCRTRSRSASTRSTTHSSTTVSRSPISRRSRRRSP